MPDGPVTSSQIFFAVVATQLLLGSVALWAFWIRQKLRGESPVPPRFRSDSIPVSQLAFLLAVSWVALNFLGDTEPQAFDPDKVSETVRSSVILGLMVFWILLAALLIQFRRPTDMARLGFRGDDLSGQLRDGFVGFVAAFAPVYAVLMASYPLRSEEVVHPFLRLVQERGIGSELIWISVAAIVIAPLSEELMFRVILQSGLKQWFGTGWGIGLAALIFASVHGFPDSLGIFPLAIVLGILYQQRRSFLAIFTAHALFNAFNLWATAVYFLE